LNKELRKPCIVANWKMQGSQKFILEFMHQLHEHLKINSNQVDIVLCPPFVYLEKVRKLINEAFYADTKIIKLGAQNLSFELQGAYTGEISASMLQDIGCEYVIVGHSERRQLFGETDAVIAKKFIAAYDGGLIPILCVGETKDEREAARTYDVVKRQVEAILAVVPIGVFKKALVAYEPVWAIGTGFTASPAQAQDVHAFIRGLLAKQDTAVANQLRILYGGSLKADNALGLFKEPDVDGGLIGGASLDAKAFLSICESVIEIERN
jgi:triosephosphate isomerase